MNDYEQLLALMKSRRSIRRFAERRVPREQLLRVLEAARWAPSNHNRQPWRFIVLEERAEITRLAAEVERELTPKLNALPAIASGYAEEFVRHAVCFGQAPVVVVALHQRPVRLAQALLAGTRRPELVSGEPLSVAMAVQNLLLAAQSLGMGTCVLTAPLIASEAFRSLLAPVAGFEPTCLVAVGYPEETPPAPRRKGLDQIVDFREDGPGLERPHDDRE